MAGRVNTKFVVTLSAVLVLVFGGVLAAALWIRLHNAPDLAKKGDARMAVGRAKLATDFAGAQTDFEAAEKLFSKAVNKEQQNPVFLEKWIDCLHTWVPENQSRTADRFNQSLIPAVRQRAIAKKTDIDAHRDYLDLMYNFSRMGFSRKGAEYYITEVERTLMLLRGSPEENTKAQTLRRYRGLVYVLMMANAGWDLTPEQIELAKADLEAAYKADPSDSEAGCAIAGWYEARARTARNDNKEDLEKELRAKAHEAIDAFVAAHPRDYVGAVRKLSMEVNEAREQIYRDAYSGKGSGQPAPRPAAESSNAPAQPGAKPDDATKPTEPAAVAQRADLALAERLKPQFEHVAELAREQIGQLKSEDLASFQMLEGFFDRAGGLARTSALLRESIEKHPDRAEPYTALAELISERPGEKETKTARYQEAIDLLQKVVDMPPRPVSLEALKLYSMKTSALYYQAVYAFQGFEEYKDPKSDQAKAWLAASRKYRDAFTQFVSPDSDLLKFVDGLHRFAESDWLGAKKLLGEYTHRFEGVNIKAEWHLAQCEIRLNNPGAAVDHLERIISVNPSIDGPVILRAGLLHGLGRTEQAVFSLENYIGMYPDNANAKEQLARIKMATGQDAPKDPVEKALYLAQRKVLGEGEDAPDPKGAIDIVQKALAEKNDVRLHRALVLVNAQMNDRDAAIAAAKAGLEKFPGDESLKMNLEGLSAQDPIAWRLAEIDKAENVSALDKALTRYSLLTAAIGTATTAEQAKGYRDAAEAALAEAAKIAPEDQRVVDRQFTNALTTSDWPAAEKLVLVAASKDFDRAGGAAYKGRLQFARGQLAEAAITLREAADKGIADVSTLRVLAIVYERQGRNDDAETYYKEALKLRPGDPLTLVAYLNLLSSTGRVPEALAKAREAEPAAKTDPTFMNILLNLEASVGDADDALKRREAIQKKEPLNFTNLLALLNLYIDAKRWDDSAKLLADLRTKGDGTDLATAEARLFFEQNQPDKAQAALDAYISRQDPKKLTYEPFVSLGRFLVDRKLYPEGCAFIQRGEAYQNPKVCEADRALAETLVSINQPDQAVIVLKKIVDNGADGPGQEVRVRLAELLIALANGTPDAKHPPEQYFKEAAEQLAQIKDRPEIGAQLAIIRADVAHGLKDDKKAGEIYARAILEYPNDPMIYFRRAQWHLSRGKPGVEDALRDLDTALRVRPTFWQARRLRSFVYYGTGEVDKAIADVRETIRINPSLDDLRLQLLHELITRDQAPLAAEIGDAAVKLRPNDVILAMSIGKVFADIEDWSRAADFYRVGWKQAKRPDVAQTLLNAILNAPNPNLGEADDIFRELMKSPGVDSAGQKVDPVVSNSGLLLARAKLQAKRGRTADAAKDLLASTSVLPPTADAVSAWFGEVRRVLPSANDQLALLGRRDLPLKFREWAAYLRAAVLSENPAARSQTVAGIEDVLANSKTPDIRRFAWRLRGNIEYNDKQYDSAEASWRKGAQEFPDDWELNNNLAYLLARYLNRPKDALPYAEAAARAAPGSAETIDTYGYVLMQGGQLDAAADEFKKALTVCRNSSTRVSIGLHLVRCLLGLNKKDEATVQMRAVQDLTSRNPKLEEQNRVEINELNGKLGSH